MADKKKILIADDFQLLREDLTELINNQRDMEVVGTASSGKEIVNLARNTEYDLILMDIEMETMNAGILATPSRTSTKESSRKHSVKLFPIYWEVTRNIATLCMPMVPEPNHLLLICTGKKRVTYPFGKVLHRMH